MDVTIETVRGRADLKRFVSFPYALYAKNPYWIPPLKRDEFATLSRDKNPAFDFCEAEYWLAYRDGKVVGRIAGIINNRYIEKWGNRYARFGWVDFIDDEEVSKSLLNAFEAWAQEKGMTATHGPLGFTDLDYEGMLVEGFDEIGTMVTIYNYPYYPTHIENYGYAKDIDWIEFEVSVPDIVPEKVERIAGIAAKKSKLRILRVKKAKKLLPFAREMFELLNTTYQYLYGFVPLTEKQMENYIKQYFSFIRPDFVSLVLDQHGTVAAFGITIPSLAKALQKANGRLFPLGFIPLLRALRKNDTADLLLVGVRPDLQGKGVNALLIDEINKIYIKNNIKRAETNPELETNSKVQEQWKFYQYRQHKRRRCYIKHLL